MTSVDLAQLPPDTYVWILYADDAVGNETATILRTFRVHRTGDIDGDSKVGAVDYFAVGKSYGQAQTNLPIADLDDDGAIGPSDVVIFRRENE